MCPKDNTMSTDWLKKDSLWKLKCSQYSYLKNKQTKTKKLRTLSHLSYSSKQRDEHDHTHELCEEDEWSEEGPHWP